MPEIKVWYSEGIKRVRAVSTPGGDALTLEQAEAFRDDLTEAIEAARRAGDDER